MNTMNIPNATRRWLAQVGVVAASSLMVVGLAQVLDAQPAGAVGGDIVVDHDAHGGRYWANYVNLAQQFGTARQSTTYWGAEANLAIDGNDAQAPNARTMAITRRQKQPWWEVHIATPSYKILSLDRINIHSDNGCCTDSLGDFWVFISDQPFTSNNPQQLAKDPNVKATRIINNEAPPVVEIGKPTDWGDGPTYDLYVRIQRQGRGHLALAEVEVMGEYENL